MGSERAGLFDAAAPERAGPKVGAVAHKKRIFWLSFHVRIPATASSLAAFQAGEAGRTVTTPQQAHGSPLAASLPPVVRLGREPIE